MRTLVEIDKNDLERLDELAAAAKRSRAALIRDAVSAFLKQRQPQGQDAFGLWGDRKVDGLAYEREARSEW